jgi:hypothetical protein
VSRQGTSWFLAYLVLVIMMTVALVYDHKLASQAELTHGQITVNEAKIQAQSELNCRAIKALSDWVTVFSSTAVAAEVPMNEHIRIVRIQSDATYLANLRELWHAAHCTELNK